MSWYIHVSLLRANGSKGNGKIEGLVDDLHMTQWQYNACLSIFFVSYSLFEPVSNVLLKRMRPKIYIPLIMVLWGLTMTFMGFVKNYSGLMAARWFLGLTEAVFSLVSPTIFHAGTGEESSVSVLLFSSPQQP